jgi:hypothetical protein
MQGGTMTKGYLTLAQNGTHDYVRMAYALALSLKLSQSKYKNISVIVNKNEEIPERYLKVFDKVIYVDEVEEEWKVQNKWQYFWVTPYDETIVLDADMLFFYDVSYWWDFLGKFNDIDFTTTVMNYRNLPTISTHHRTVFIENNLPNLYTALFYFKKTDEVERFFRLVKLMFQNWEDVYQMTLKNPPKFVSGDVIYALAAITLFNRNWENHLRLTHMRGKIQDESITGDWNKYLPVFFTQLNDRIGLKVSNYDQKYPFHYIKKNFLTNEVIELYENKICLL